MIAFGSQGVYEWLVTDQQFDLLSVCPEVVLNRYIAITSIDSSPLVLNVEETAAGWETRGKIAYSPKIQPEMKDLAALFWQQIERIRPESYMADNDYLNFVCANRTLFATVRSAVKAL